VLADGRSGRFGVSCQKASAISKWRFDSGLARSIEFRRPSAELPKDLQHLPRSGLLRIETARQEGEAKRERVKQEIEAKRDRDKQEIELRRTYAWGR
jgi:hypothetical protein